MHDGMQYDPIQG